MTGNPTKKSICVILDAMIVIEAHALAVWNHLLDRIDAVLPSTVVKNEAFYFDAKKTGRRGPILIRQGISRRLLDAARLTKQIRRALSTVPSRPSRKRTFS